MAKTRTSRRRAPLPKRKNMVIDQQKLDAARRALGLETETATVDAALDLVVFRTELFAGLDRVVATGGVATRTGARKRR